jgi:hypothetical protein
MGISLHTAIIRSEEDGQFHVEGDIMVTPFIPHAIGALTLLPWRPARMSWMIADGLLENFDKKL